MGVQSRLWKNGLLQEYQNTKVEIVRRMGENKLKERVNVGEEEADGRIMCVTA